METCHVADDNQLFLCKTGDLAPGSVLKVERPEGALAQVSSAGVADPRTQAAPAILARMTATSRPW
jgi:hypothetical protein